MHNKKIAVFGGSFNPPLKSHLNLARQVLKEFSEIEMVYFVPVNEKYGKESLIQNEYRLEMLNLLLCNENKMKVSDIEIKENKKTYTIDTLEKMKKQHPKSEIYFIMGLDNLKEFPKWKSPEEILKNFKLIVLERGIEKVEDIIKREKILLKYEKNIIKLKNIEKIDFSSTCVRNKISKNENVDKYLPEKILDYIKSKKLYK